MIPSKSILPSLLLLLCFYCVSSQYYTPNVQTGSGAQATSKKFALEEELRKFQNTVASGDISTVNTLINNALTNSFIQCPQMSTYIKKVTEIMKKKISSNQKELKTPLVKESSQNNAKNYDELTRMLTDLKNNISKAEYSADLERRTTQLIKADKQYEQYLKLCDQYLDNLKQIKKQNNIVSNTVKEETAILKLESQLKAIDDKIEETKAKRASIHKNISSVKVSLLAEQIAYRESVSQQSLQAQYRKYSELALQVSQKSKDKEQQLSKLKSALQTKLLTPTSVDDELAKTTKLLEERKSAGNEKILSAYKNANEVLKNNLKILEDKIIIVESGCFFGY